MKQTIATIIISTIVCFSFTGYVLYTVAQEIDSEVILYNEY